jgi:hypothetical protein
MDLTLDMSNIHRDAPTATLELVTKWEAPLIAEFDNYRARTPRLIRVATYGNLIVPPSGTDRHSLIIDGCYVATDFVPLDSERDGTTLARATFTAVENNANLYSGSPTLTWPKKIEETDPTTGELMDTPLPRPALPLDWDTLTGWPSDFLHYTIGNQCLADGLADYLQHAHPNLRAGSGSISG